MIIKTPKDKTHRRLTLIIFAIFLKLFCLGCIASEESSVPLEKALVDLTDLPSLQRGAKLFMNYCSACHSLKYVRYQTMAKDIGIVDASGKVLDQVVKNNLMFTGEKITDPIKSALTKDEGSAWFGVAPPDLSLVSRSRSVDWLYTYLKSFYMDPQKPWGVNNKIFPSVAMPDVLFNFRKQLFLQKDGEAKFDRAVLDIVNFLAYVGEPMQLERKKIGIWVLLFLSVFFIFACLLKREYWKDVYSKSRK
jgi:ubiquinol-cytochrome c reductase cytochrome c1 subunit